MKPRILDLFCGAGGSAMGLHQAGFEVVGVDIKPQKHYPFEFHQGDALTYPLDGFDAYWASPPCQEFSWSARRAKREGTLTKNYGDCLTPIRQRLVATDKPYIIENVVGSPLVTPWTLCGLMFDLQVIRHRNFEINWLAMFPPHPTHRNEIESGRRVTVVGHGGGSKDFRISRWREAMGIDWMTKAELVEAIPPAYSRFIGEQLMKVILPGVPASE